MWPKLYYRWMMLHKYILNLDSWKNTVCYEDWQLCLVISFSTKKLGTLSTKLELTEHCIISRCFTLASKIFHSQYFNRVQISNQLPRETVSPSNTLKITLSISKHMRFDELIVSNNRQYLFYYGKLVWYLYWVLESCMEILTHTVFSGHLLSQSVCRCTSLHKK